MYRMSVTVSGKLIKDSSKRVIWLLSGQFFHHSSAQRDNRYTQ